jgi:hypothetical protein
MSCAFWAPVILQQLQLAVAMRTGSAKQAMLCAAEMLGRIIADIEHVLGPRHPDTFANRGNLAYWMQESGDSEGALAAYEDLLADMQRTLETDHPAIFVVRANLAGCRGRAGDPVAAASELRLLLADRFRVLGPSHPDTLRTQQNLAEWEAAAIRKSRTVDS